MKILEDDDLVIIPVMENVMHPSQFEFALDLARKGKKVLMITNIRLNNKFVIINKEGEANIIE